MSEKHTHMVLIVYEGLRSITPFPSLAEAEAYFDRAAEQWSEAYILAVVRGPIDCSAPAPPDPRDAEIERLRSQARALACLLPHCRWRFGAEYPCKNPATRRVDGWLCCDEHAKGSGSDLAYAETVRSVLQETWEAEHGQ